MVLNIQALRALAAFLVVLHHANPHYISMGGSFKWLSAVSEFGYVGVDIFFVISGYVIASTIWGKPNTFSQSTVYLEKRVFRIYTGYWPFFFIYLFAYLAIKPEKLGQVDLLDSFLLSSPDMFQLLIPVSWSLTYELYFYILFFGLFYLPRKMLGPALVMFYILLLAFNLQFNATTNPITRFFLSPLILEFLSGSLLFIYLKNSYGYLRTGLSLIFCVLATTLGVFFVAKNGYLRVATFGTSAFFLVYLAILLENQNIKKVPRWIVKLGDASYTTYLCHLLLILLFYASGTRDWLRTQGGLIVEIGYLLVLFGILAFSVIYYLLLEKPLYRTALSTKWIRPSSWQFSTYR